MKKNDYIPTNLIVSTALSVLVVLFLIQEYLEQHVSLFLYCLVLGYVIGSIIFKYSEYFDHLEKNSSEADYLDSLKLSQVQSGGLDLTLKELFSTTDSIKAVKLLIDDYSGWEIDFIKEGLLLHIKPYSQKQVIQILYTIHMSDGTEKVQQQNEKILQCLTISAIVFGFQIPSHMAVSDVQMTKNLFRYLAYTAPISKVNLLERAVIKYPIENAPERMREQRLHHEYLVKCIESAFLYIEHTNTNQHYRSKNFWLVREIIRTNATKHPNGPSVALNALDEGDLRKVFTMAYLSIGMHVPMDYISVDDFVLDFIMKTEKYHKFNKPVFSLVTTPEEEVENV